MTLNVAKSCYDAYKRCLVLACIQLLLAHNQSAPSTNAGKMPLRMRMRYFQERPFSTSAGHQGPVRTATPVHQAFANSAPHPACASGPAVPADACAHPPSAGHATPCPSRPTHPLPPPQPAAPRQPLETIDLSADTPPPLPPPQEAAAAAAGRENRQPPPPTRPRQRHRERRQLKRLYPSDDDGDHGEASGAQPDDLLHSLQPEGSSHTAAEAAAMRRVEVVPETAAWGEPWELEAASRACPAPAAAPEAQQRPQQRRSSAGAAVGRHDSRHAQEGNPGRWPADSEADHAAQAEAVPPSIAAEHLPRNAGQPRDDPSPSHGAPANVLPMSVFPPRGSSMHAPARASFVGRAPPQVGSSTHASGTFIRQVAHAEAADVPLHLCLVSAACKLLCTVTHMTTIKFMLTWIYVPADRSHPQNTSA